MANGNLYPIINFIWSVADDVLVHAYKKGKYGDVILPMTVIRRLDLVLEPTKDRVYKSYIQYKDKLNNLDTILTSQKDGSGKQFYNTSKFTLKTLLNDPKNIRANFEDYLNGFSRNVQDIIDKFKFRNQLDTLEEEGLLFGLIEKFVSPKVNIHPDSLSNHDMGYVFEDLVRRFNEENNEEAGEHFTPREIIELMTNIVFLPVKDKIRHGTFLVYDPCSGSGGMLTEARDFVTKPSGQIKSEATIHLYGQEVQPETYATCKSDFLIKGDDPEKIAFGSTLTKDGFSDLKFDFMLTNPPYGKSWGKDKELLSVGPKGAILDSRFQIGIPRVSDGQLMFLQHMISKMKNDTELGSRIASVHNGSALFTGDAGQGESEIRRYLFEHDLLECIIALPTDMFYNTGIPTYIFLLSNRKSEERKGKVLLVNATGKQFYKLMKKNLGKKRVELLEEHVQKIVDLYLDFKEGKNTKIFDNEDLGYRQIIVHQPLRESDGKIITDSRGNPKSDTALKDSENIPLREDVDEFFKREVLPYTPDAWYNPAETKIGYEISFNKYFYKYSPSRSLQEIAVDLENLDKESEKLLEEITD